MISSRHIVSRLGAASLALAAAACGGSAPADTPAPPAVSVSTVKASSRDVPVYLHASGSILAGKASEVAAMVSGYVNDIPVSAGAAVAVGDVLVILDPTVARLQADEADSAVVEANANVESAKAASITAKSAAELEVENATGMQELFDKGGASRQQVEQAQQRRDSAAEAADEAQLRVVSAEAALRSAEARATLAHSAVAATQVRAPFDGFVGSINASTGEYVGEGTAVAQVISLDPVEVEVQISEGDLPAISVGLDATATVVAYPQRSFAGKIISVGAAVSPASRTVGARIRFDNADGALRPGMFATVQISRANLQKAVFVPTSALVQDPTSGSTHVFAVVNGEAVLKVVETGAASGDQTRILTGLDADAEVATTALAQLRDGIKVTTGS